MKVLYIVIAVISVPATLLLSHLFWFWIREARAIAMILSSPNFLRQLITKELLIRPPAVIAHFAELKAEGYAFNMRAFHEADRQAHARGRSLLRPVLPVLILGSGIVGFLAMGWLGLALPIINIFAMLSTFMTSSQGAIDKSAVTRAEEHVKTVALILHRWKAISPQEAAEWAKNNLPMKPLWDLLAINLIDQKENGLPVR